MQLRPANLVKYPDYSDGLRFLRKAAGVTAEFLNASDSKYGFDILFPVDENHIVFWDCLTELWEEEVCRGDEEEAGTGHTELRDHGQRAF